MDSVVIPPTSVDSVPEKVVEPDSGDDIAHTGNHEMSTVNDPNGVKSSVVAESDQEGESDDECSDEGSDGEDLAGDLEASLSGGSFNQAKSFFYCSTDIAAPNPGLMIEGVGFIGLPMPDRDAKLILSAPFGTIDETGAKEVEAGRISFTNIRWRRYVENLGSITIPSALGVPQNVPKPRCELLKLLLHPPGAKFSLRRDPLTTNGVPFATVVIVLPSPFDGGEVHVTHAQQTQTFNTFKDSAFDTSIMAWYTDATPAGMPVTSGYRLVLVYNLMHTPTEATPVQQPSLPGLQNDLDAIRRVFRKWKNYKYDNIPSLPVVAYLLTGDYGKAEIARGFACLKGSDAHRTAYILLIAKEFGFVVCLGHLKSTVSGIPAEREDYYEDRWGCDYGEDEDDDEREPPEMEEVESQTDELSGLVRLSEGMPMRCASFELSEEESLVPRRPFEGDIPHDTHYTEYPPSLEHYYEGSVLVLFHEMEEVDIMIRINGVKWAIQELNTCQTRCRRSQELATRVSSRLESEPTEPSSALALLRYAAGGKDIAMWTKIVPYCRYNPASLGSVIKQALQVFDVKSILPGLLSLLTQTPVISERFEVLKAIDTNVSDPEIAVWADELIQDAICLFSTTVSVADLPNILWIAQKRGIEPLHSALGKILEQQPGIKERVDVVKPVAAQIGEPAVFARWMDLNLLRNIVTSVQSVGENDIPNLLWIGQRVGLENVRDVLDKIVKQIPELSRRFDVVRGFQGHFGEEVVSAWLDDLMSHLGSGTEAKLTTSTTDIPTLLWICEKKGFNTIRASLTSIAKNIPGLEHRFEIVKSVEHKLGEAVTSGWVNELIDDAISTYVDPSSLDIPSLLWIAGKRGVESIRKIVDTLVKATPDLQRRFETVKIIESGLGADAISAWINDWTSHAASSYTLALVGDVPILVWITRKADPDIINTMLRNISKKASTYGFLVAFSKALCQDAASSASTALPASAETAPAADFSQLAQQCILAAVPQWDAVPSRPAHTGYSYGWAGQSFATPPSSPIDRICELVEVCLTTLGSLVPCTNLLTAILRMRDASKMADRIKTVGVPLVPRLKAILAKHNTPTTMEPFGSFFKTLISLYLVHVLGKKPSGPSIVVRSIGCGVKYCQECAQLNTFLTNSTPTLSFRLVQSRRTHVENQINRGGVSHLISYTTIRRGTPHTLSITKLPSALAAFTWKERQSAALAFVKSVAEDAVLATIMGDRLVDVMNAIQGTTPFAYAPSRVLQMAAAGGPSASHQPAQVPAVGSSTAVGGSVPVAGAKRKQRDPPENVVGVIDLT